MKRLFICLIVMLLTTMTPFFLYSQKNPGSIYQITSSDMESHISFLSSPLLKGRMNGEEGLEIASLYIVSQAKLTGLKPANGNSYFQPYSISIKSIDTIKSRIQIIPKSNDTVTIKEPLYQLFPTGPSDFIIEEEVVFAGYGIKTDKYNDFEDIITNGKILLVMDRAPMSEDGKKCLFEDPEWSSESSYQMKLTNLILSKAKAILFVSDPKSGFRSFKESSSELAEYLRTKITLNSEKPEITNSFMSAMPKVIFIHRSIADSLLKGSGHTLEELQKSIDKTLQPHSFAITGKHLYINEVSKTENKILNNIAGYIEGSDPVLKNEVIIFSGHYDHIGTSGGRVNEGADDNASGCAALLSIAEAFQSMEKKPLRSILFLWFSGEEIGLFGSKSYVDNPLFPLNKTIADLNMDMIGRIKEVADSTEDTPMTGPNTVFVITDNQSRELRSIANEIDRKTILDFDYSLSGRNHPMQLFSRSDHFNFVEKDIPVLLFTSGVHSDYHTPGDVIEKIDLKKMEMITRTVYEIGLTIANRKARLVVDNPFSTW